MLRLGKNEVGSCRYGETYNNVHNIIFSLCSKALLFLATIFMTSLLFRSMCTLHIDSHVPEFFFCVCYILLLYVALAGVLLVVLLFITTRHDRLPYWK